MGSRSGKKKNKASMNNAGKDGGAKRPCSPIPSTLNDSLMRDRLQFLMANLQGQVVCVEKTNGEIFEGIFTCADEHAEDQNVELRVARLLPPRGRECLDPSNPDSLPLQKPIANLLIKSQDIVQILASDVVVLTPSDREETAGRSFREESFSVDTEISGRRDLRERELQPWTPEGEIPQHLDIDLDAHGGNTSWDQFKTNETLFGVKTTYAEEFYTTKLDRNSEVYRKTKNHAIRIADEIMHRPSSHTHVLIERGTLQAESNLDEEQLFSSVVRPVDQPSGASSQKESQPQQPQQTQQQHKDQQLQQSSSAKYVPPHKRVNAEKDISAPSTPAAPPATSAPTVRPVDSIPLPTFSPPPSEVTAPKPTAGTDAVASALPPKKREIARERSSSLKIDLPQPEEHVTIQVKRINQIRTRVRSGSFGGVMPSRTEPVSSDSSSTPSSDGLSVQMNEFKRIRRLLTTTKPQSPKLVGGMGRLSPSSQSPILSPLVGDIEKVIALNLDPGAPKVGPELARIFNEYSEHGRIKNRKQEIEELKRFSIVLNSIDTATLNHKLDERNMLSRIKMRLAGAAISSCGTGSAPASLRDPSSPIRSISSLSPPPPPEDEREDQEEEAEESDEKQDSASVTGSEHSSTSTDATASTTNTTSSLNKQKLNPNAKPFQFNPHAKSFQFNPNSKPFTPPSSSQQQPSQQQQGKKPATNWPSSPQKRSTTVYKQQPQPPMQHIQQIPIVMDGGLGMPPPGVWMWIDPVTGVEMPMYFAPGMQPMPAPMLPLRSGPPQQQSQQQQQQQSASPQPQQFAPPPFLPPGGMQPLYFAAPPATAAALPSSPTGGVKSPPGPGPQSAFVPPPPPGANSNSSSSVHPAVQSPPPPPPPSRARGPANPPQFMPIYGQQTPGFYPPVLPAGMQVYPTPGSPMQPHSPPPPPPRGYPAFVPSQHPPPQSPQNQAQNGNTPAPLLQSSKQQQQPSPPPTQQPPPPQKQPAEPQQSQQQQQQQQPARPTSSPQPAQQPSPQQRQQQSPSPSQQSPSPSQQTTQAKSKQAPPTKPTEPLAPKPQPQPQSQQQQQQQQAPSKQQSRAQPQSQQQPKDKKDKQPAISANSPDAATGVQYSVQHQPTPPHQAAKK